MTDTWTWATVTQSSPLRIKVDGDTSALDATTDNLVGSLAVFDRVRVHLHSDGIIVTGLQGGGNRSKPNLLINSNFMVNQREAVSGNPIADGAYFLDRWKNTSGEPTSVITWADSAGVRTVTLGNASNTRTMRQVVEQRNAPAGTYTLSWSGGVVGRAYLSGASVPTLAASPVTVTLAGTADVFVELVGTNETVSNIKLEQGSVATPYQPPRYDDNLRDCQRYYYRKDCGFNSSPVGPLAVIASTIGVATVEFLTAMRAAPTFTSSAVSGFSARSGAATVTLTGAYQDSANYTSAALVVTVASGLTTGQSGYVRANSASSQYVAFDAEL